MEKNARPRDVDSYIASVPRELRALVRTLRAVIRRAAPAAEERISYGMPYYHYKGRLAYFRLQSHHLGLYIPTPVLKRHARELKGYHAAGATLRLPLDKKLPVGIIRKLIKARIAERNGR